MTSPRHIPIFDGHNDVLLRLYRRGGTDAPRAFLEGEGNGQLDLPMARQGGFAGGLFAIFVPSANGAIGPNGEAPSPNASSGAPVPPDPSPGMSPRFTSVRHFYGGLGGPPGGIRAAAPLVVWSGMMRTIGAISDTHGLLRPQGSETATPRPSLGFSPSCSRECTSRVSIVTAIHSCSGRRSWLPPSPTDIPLVAC
jgi:hypothetical protein